MQESEYIQRLEKLEKELAELKMSRARKTIRTLKSNRRTLGGFIACMVLIPAALHAFAIPNTFVAGNPAIAADVNANFTAIKNQFDAMENKSWRLIAEYDISSPTTTLNMTGLNGDVDFEYKIIAKISGGAGGGAYYVLRPNGDSAAGSYFFKMLTGDGTVASSTTTPPSNPGIYFGYTGSSSFTTVESRVLAKTGSIRIFSGNFANAVSGSGVTAAIGITTAVWKDTVNNITSFQLVAENTNGIDVGSHIEIWARR